MKFNLTVNEAHQDGFKLTTDASSEAECKLVKDLTEKLIEKISVIEVKVGGGDDY